MKNTFYILCLLAISLVSCETDFDAEEQGIILEELPNYVAFSVDGVGVTLDPITVSEADGDTDDQINIEIPGGTLSDVTVNYTLGGTAVYGTDYTIDGATSAGGSIVIDYNNTPNVDGLPFNVDLVVDLLTDGVVDGEKTLDITLTSASNAEGDISVGRGLTDILTVANITILDGDYVAFASSSLSVEEGEEDVFVTLEAYPGNERDSDVTVTYTLGGTAVFGTDYTIAGATAAGGTAIIVPNVDEDGDPSTLDLEVIIFDNIDISGEDDDPKTIEVTITGASDIKEPELILGIDDEDDDLTVATITINDNDSDYVAFAPSSEVKSVAENDGPINLTLEAYPGGNRETVTVNYTITGTAELGTDYTIVGASTTNNVTTGSVVIAPNVSEPFGPSITTFQVVLLTDDVKDGEKTVIITLDDASEPSTDDIPVGVNGGNSLTSATITIIDID